MTPIALFIFNRPSLTAQLYERVRAARPERLLVVADGPRHARSQDIELCEATRKLVISPDWPCELLTNFSEQNLGPGRRISSGLNWVFDQCQEAIILEDDCIPCASFFAFCANLLHYYRDDARIMHISGDNYQGGVRRGEASYFFSRYSLSWGWATWRRAWRYYDFGISNWPVARQEGWLDFILDDRLEIEYWTGIFDRLHRGFIDAWDYQWLFTCWCQHGLTIQPNVNLVSNIGVGADATNFKQANSMIGVPTQELNAYLHPTTVIRDKNADRYTFKNHIQPRRVSRWQSLRNRLAIRTRLRRLRNLVSRTPLGR